MNKWHFGQRMMWWKISCIYSVCMEWNNMETFWWRPHLPSRRQEGTSFLRVTECRNPWSWMAARSSRLQSPPAAETCTDQALPQSFREGVTTILFSYQTTLYLVERDLSFNVKHLVCIKLKQIKVLRFVTDRSRPLYGFSIWCFTGSIIRRRRQIIHTITFMYRQKSKGTVHRWRA